MLKHIKGNLIDLAEAGHFDVIVHGCNCQNVMGSGIAKELRARHPGVFDADTKAAQQWQHPIAKLGNFSIYSTQANHPFVVINAYTQVHYLPRGVDHFEYESFYLILRKLSILGSVRFGFPYIGMGLAGGDETKILKLLEDFAKSVSAVGGSVTLVEYAS